MAGHNVQYNIRLPEVRNVLTVGYKNPSTEVTVSTHDAAGFKASIVHNVSQQLQVGVQAEWPVKGAPAVEAAVDYKFNQDTSAGAKLNQAGHFAVSAKHRFTKNVTMSLQATIDTRSTGKNSAGIGLQFEL